MQFKYFFPFKVSRQTIFMYSNIILGPFTKLTVKRAPRFKLPELETFILELLLYIEVGLHRSILSEREITVAHRELLI